MLQDQNLGSKNQNFQWQKQNIDIIFWTRRKRIYITYTCLKHNLASCVTLRL